MPKFEQIETEISDNILTITMKRPDRLNAFTPQMQGELIDAFDHADANDDIGAIIVTGAGRAFCAGADLSDGGSTWEKPELARDGGGRLTLRIFESLKPVIGYSPCSRNRHATVSCFLGAAWYRKPAQAGSFLASLASVRHSNGLTQGEPSKPTKR